MAIVVGVVWFDDATNPTAGWMCAVGIEGARAVRVQSPSDVPRDMVWITNLPYLEFYRVGWGMQSHLRHAGFIRPGLDTIANESGLSEASPEVRVEVLAALADRCLLFARACGVPYTGQNKPSLGHVLQATLFPTQRSHDDPSVEGALAAAYQVDSSVSAGSMPRGSRIVKARNNRTAYWQQVLSSSVPTGSWRLLEAVNLPTSVKARVEWAIQSPVPVLVRARVHRADPEYSDLIAFGASIAARSVRQWMTAPEVMWLSAFADVDISAAWVASEYAAPLLPAQCVAALDADFSLPPSALYLAPSVGIFLENFAHGAMAENTGQGPAKSVSARAAWLRAIDRGLSFVSAVRLAKNGLRVLGYGNGEVRCVVEEGAATAVLNAISAAGLVAPMWLPSAQRAARILEEAA